MWVKSQYDQNSQLLMSMRTQQSFKFQDKTRIFVFKIRKENKSKSKEDHLIGPRKLESFLWKRNQLSWLHDTWFSHSARTCWASWVCFRLTQRKYVVCLWKRGYQYLGEGSRHAFLLCFFFTQMSQWEKEEAFWVFVLWVSFWTDKIRNLKKPSPADQSPECSMSWSFSRPPLPPTCFSIDSRSLCYRLLTLSKFTFESLASISCIPLHSRDNGRLLVSLFLDI